MPDKTGLPEPAPDGQVLIYQDGATHLQVRLEGRSVWLSQRLIAELFQVSVKTANEHLVNIYSERELDPEATIRSFRIVQMESSREVAIAGIGMNGFALTPAATSGRGAGGTRRFVRGELPAAAGEAGRRFGEGDQLMTKARKRRGGVPNE